MRLFLIKVFCTAFLKLQFGFVIFWYKNIGAKAACKMLMKLTTGVIQRGLFCMIAMEAAKSLAKDQNSNV
jgi:hypothetical protein